MNNLIARGGTELMADRINSIDPELLENVQIIHSRVRELEEGKKKILVLHDLPLDPESQHLKDGGWEKFDILVFVSHWQQQMYHAYLGVPYSAGVVLKNAIEPIEAHEKPDDKVRLLYYSTPHRGLDILSFAFEELYKEFGDQIELNVFSSFDLYGWGERDQNHAELFEDLKEMDGVNYNKSVSNERIREEIKRSHIFAYPSTWQETSCLCLIEAMSGGLVCTHSSLAALPETSMGLTTMYGYTEDKNSHLNIFYGLLQNQIRAMLDEKARSIVQNSARNVKLISDMAYDMKIRKQQWENLLRNLS